MLLFLSEIGNRIARFHLRGENIEMKIERLLVGTTMLVAGPLMAETVVDLNGETVTIDNTYFNTLLNNNANGEVRLTNGALSSGDYAQSGMAAGTIILDGVDWTASGKINLAVSSADDTFTLRLKGGAKVTTSGEYSSSYSGSGTVALEVTDGSTAVFGADSYACYNSSSSINPKCIITVDGEGSSLTAPRLRVGRNSSSGASACPFEFTLNVTNGAAIAFTGDGLVLGANSAAKTGTKARVNVTTGSTMTTGQIWYDKLIADCIVCFDDATLTLGSDSDALNCRDSTLTGQQFVVGENGLTLAQSANAATIKFPLSGSGAITKTGSQTVTFSTNDQSLFTGTLVAEEGTLALGSFSYAAKGVKFAGGTFTGAANFTEESEFKYIFANGTDESVLSSLSFTLADTDPEYVYETSGEETWAAGDGSWSVRANWEPASTPAMYDTVIFTNDDDIATTYDLSGISLGEIRKSGAGTLTIANFAAGAPVMTNFTGGITLTGTVGTNPFSTAEDSLRIAGALDLGGASQTTTTSNGKTLPVLYDGATIRNGTVTINKSANAQWQPYGEISLVNATLNLATGLRLGLFYNADTTLTLDNATLNCPDTSAAYIGTDNYKTYVMRLVNGGAYAGGADIAIGRANATGILAITNGTFNIGTKTMRLGSRGSGKGTLAMNGGTLTAGEILLGETGQSTNSASAKLTFGGGAANTTVNAYIINAVTNSAGASVTFDGVKLNHRRDGNLFWDDEKSATPIFHLAAGGLTIESEGANRVSTIPVTLDGEGGITIAARIVSFAADQSYTGATTVKSGATMKVERTDYAPIAFAGDVVFEEAAAFAAPNIQDGKARTRVLSTTGTITGAENLAKTDGNRFFVVAEDGKTVLYYGKPQGMIVIFR